MGRKRHPEELRVDEHPIWSPTRLDTAESCMKFYWLKYVKHVHLEINSSICRGKLLHSSIENFWKKDKETGLIVPKYSYSGFIGRIVGDWKRFYAQGREPGGKKMDNVAWDYPGQEWDKNYIGEIAEIAGKVYTRYLQEEPCLAAEATLYGEIEGIKIMAKIDEIRKGLVVRDHKSGYKKPREKYLNNNIQMTDYLVCLYMALQNPKSQISREVFPEDVGIGLEDFLKQASIEIHHLPGILRSPRMNKQTKQWEVPELKESITGIYQAKRNLDSINDFVFALKSNEKAIRDRDFHPTKGRNCDFCLARKVCDNYDPEKEHNDELRRNVPLFAFSNLRFQNMKHKEERIGRQKIMRFKPIDSKKGDQIKASSVNASKRDKKVYGKKKKEHPEFDLDL